MENYWYRSFSRNFSFLLKSREINCFAVTQPRRIAALSIAKRVSQEREWPVGTIVGYQMGLIKNICSDTRITYCTTGVLLHKLINKKHMMDYTHVILDEVHERDEDMDFLLLVIRKLLRTNSTMVKVILMSATIDVDKFAEYFSTPMENKLLPATVIDVPGGSPYNISIYYLDEMEDMGIVSIYFLSASKRWDVQEQEQQGGFLILRQKKKRTSGIVTSRFFLFLNRRSLVFIFMLYYRYWSMNKLPRVL